MPPIERVAAIVLAAGASTRLGQAKQLVAVPYQGDRETLVRRAARLVVEAGCSPVLVVLGACAQPCREALAEMPSVAILHNELWREGMGTTLRAGILALSAGRAHTAISSVLVTVTDQAYVSAQSLGQLLAAHQRNESPATAAFYAGRAGVPAIFRRELFPALAALQADQGARFLLAQLGARTAKVPMPEAAFDLDTPEDLRRLKKEG